MKIKERTQIAYTKLIKKGMSTKGIADALHKTEDEVKTIFTFFEQLDRFEKDLESL
jgi:DNA-binding NarL/FixJ family response regulator